MGGNVAQKHTELVNRRDVTFQHDAWPHTSDYRFFRSLQNLQRKNKFKNSLNSNFSNPMISKQCCKIIIIILNKNYFLPLDD